MAYKNQSATKPIIPCPAGITQEMANVIRDSKITFFTKIFSKSEILSHPKSVYSTIINSPDTDGRTIEAQVGTVNAKALMSEILFKLTTGYSHT